MVKVNLTYPNGAVLATETISVTDLISALKSVGSPDTTAVFMVDKPQEGLIPLQIIGLLYNPALTSLVSFQLQPVVDLD